MLKKEDYFKELTARSEKNKNRVSQHFQSTGLAIAEILEDSSHKALYIKLAKQYDEITLTSLAKRIAENKQIKNRGAYFMRLLQDMKQKPNKKRI